MQLPSIILRGNRLDPLTLVAKDQGRETLREGIGNANQFPRPTKECTMGQDIEGGNIESIDVVGNRGFRAMHKVCQRFHLRDPLEMHHFPNHLPLQTSQFGELVGTKIPGARAPVASRVDRPGKGPKPVCQRNGQHSMI